VLVVLWRCCWCLAALYQARALLEVINKCRLASNLASVAYMTLRNMHVTAIVSTLSCRFKCYEGASTALLA
jgi:hypothetical protein